jgi:hypothetical protein
MHQWFRFNTILILLDNKKICSVDFQSALSNFRLVFISNLKTLCGLISSLNTLKHKLVLIERDRVGSEKEQGRHNNMRFSLK